MMMAPVQGPARGPCDVDSQRVDGRMVGRCDYCYLAATAETLFLKYDFLPNDDPYRH